MNHPVLPEMQPLQNADALNCETPCPGRLDNVRLDNMRLDNGRQMQPDLLEANKAQQMAEFFAVLADPNRLRLLSALAQQELCVCDLAAMVKMSESAVSHQLRVLRSMRLVRYRRDGRKIYYGLADSHVINLYREVAEHLSEPEI